MFRRKSTAYSPGYYLLRTQSDDKMIQGKMRRGKDEERVHFVFSRMMISAQLLSRFSREYSSSYLSGFYRSLETVIRCTVKLFHLTRNYFLANHKCPPFLQRFNFVNRNFLFIKAFGILDFREFGILPIFTKLSTARTKVPLQYYNY